MGWQVSLLFVLGICAETFQEGICLHLEIMFLHLKQHLQDAEALSYVGALTWISVAVLGNLLRRKICKFSARD